MARITNHPLGPGRWPLSSPWRPSWRPAHRGVDIPVYKRPLYAAISGVARRKDQPGGAGWFVEITSPDGRIMVSTFHMSRVDIVDGQRVVGGQQIGVSGGVRGEPGAGNTTGAHLHFEIWERGVDTNPAPDLDEVTNQPTAPVTPPPEEQDEMSTEQEARILTVVGTMLGVVRDDLYSALSAQLVSERAHNAAMKDQTIAAVAILLDAGFASDEATDTRLRDEMAKLVRDIEATDAARDAALAELMPTHRDDLTTRLGAVIDEALQS